MSQSRCAIVFTSKGGTTRRIAERLKDCLPGSVSLFELEDFQSEVPASYDFLFFGSPTYGLGDLDYRWKKYLRGLDYESLKHSNSRVALFVLGDQKWHGRTFAGSLVDFSTPFQGAGINLEGRWPADDYDFIASPAVDPDGSFPGLVIDEVSQPELTEDRLSRWSSQVFDSASPVEENNTQLA